MQPKPRIARELLEEPVADLSAQDGRRRNGTFAPGNAANKGRGHELREWRAAFKESFCAARLAEVVGAMYRAACKGNVHAARLLLDHALGRPRERVDLNVLDYDPSSDPSSDEYFA